MDRLLENTGVQRERERKKDCISATPLGVIFNLNAFAYQEMQLRKVNTERKTPEIEKRSVTSRYRGSKISGSQQYGAKQR